MVILERRNISLEQISSFELCPMPAALFDEYGIMRSGSKSVLVQKLAVNAIEDVPTAEIDVEIVDGNAMLYHVSWPKVATVKQFCEMFYKLVEKKTHCLCGF